MFRTTGRPYVSVVFKIQDIVSQKVHAHMLHTMSVLQMLCVLDAGDLPRCCLQITRAIRFSLRCFSFTSPSCTTDVSDDYIETRSISRRWCGISFVACSEKCCSFCLLVPYVLGFWWWRSWIIRSLAFCLGKCCAWREVTYKEVILCMYRCIAWPWGWNHIRQMWRGRKECTWIFWCKLC